MIEFFCEVRICNFKPFSDRRNKRFRLHPENDKYEDMFYKEIAIQGVAVKVIKSLED